MTGKGHPRRTVPAGTASRWALIRSRLPYRVGAMASTGFILALLVTGILVARSNTPLGMVVSNAGQDLSVTFTTKDGQVAFDRLEAGRPYALIRRDDSGDVLRRWVPGAGYSELTSPPGMCIRRLKGSSYPPQTVIPHHGSAPPMATEGHSETTEGHQRATRQEGSHPYALKVPGPPSERLNHPPTQSRPLIRINVLPEVSAMSAPSSLALTLDAALAERLAAAAETSGLAPADIALRALQLHLDGVTAYGRVVDDLAQIKTGLADLAGAVGEALTEPEPGAVDSICRYKPGKA